VLLEADGGDSRKGEQKREPAVRLDLPPGSQRAATTGGVRAKEAEERNKNDTRERGQERVVATAFGKWVKLVYKKNHQKGASGRPERKRNGLTWVKPSGSVREKRQTQSNRQVRLSSGHRLSAGE